MEISDYLIEQAGKDWSELLTGWSPALPTSFTLLMVYRFGDVFVVYEDESVHMLDVGMGATVRVAENTDDFCDKIDLGENANNWLLIDFVDDCLAAGLVLGQDQCYGYKVPPVLGGKYTIDNVVPTDLSVHYRFLADIYQQTKDLPDGTRIKTVII